MSHEESQSREDFLKQLMQFITDTGFVWGPEPEIYGGISGFYTYAPLGKLLKNNVEAAIRRVFQTHQFWEVECPTVQPKAVWQASGHLGGFTDPLIKAEDGAHYRVDKLIEEQLGYEKNLSGMSEEEIIAFMAEHDVTAPNGKALVPKIYEHSLMMRTTIGVDTEAYNRPETATTTYLPFRRYDSFFRNKYPFSVFQIGKAYRNEISPRQHILRGREFTQAEGQIFILEHQKNDDKFVQQFTDDVAKTVLPMWHMALQEDSGDGADHTAIPEELSLAAALDAGHLKNKAYAYALYLAYKLFVNMGIPKENIRLRQHLKDERAFYADDAWDVEVKTNAFGWVEMAGVHDRTNYDLSVHAKHSGVSLETYDEATKTKHVPHIIEIAFGVDRPVFALMDIFYDASADSNGKNHAFRIPVALAPVKCGIFPLVKKGGLPEKAQELFDSLIADMYCVFDERGSIGRRYARADEAGYPYCITVDFDSLEDNCVTIRDRDSQEQKRIAFTEVASSLRSLLKGNALFSDL